MGSVVLVGIGGFLFLVVLAILIGAVQGIKTVVIGIFGIAKKILALFVHFPLLTMLLLAGSLLTEYQVICFVIYGFLVILSVKKEVENDVKKQIEGILQERGILSKTFAASIEPSANSSIDWLRTQLFEEGWGIKFLDQQAEKKEVECGRLEDDQIYYYKLSRWKQMQRNLEKEACSILADYTKKWGVMTYDIPLELQCPHEDLSSLLQAVFERCRHTYIKQNVDNNNFLVGTAANEQGDKEIYIDKLVAESKWFELQDIEVVDQVVLERYFDMRDVTEQSILMEVMLRTWDTGNYEFVEHNKHPFWIKKDSIKNHLCEQCQTLAHPLSKYGPTLYCEDCLDAIHKKEAEEESKGKPVKRYIDAPPPGVKIHT